MGKILTVKASKKGEKLSINCTVHEESDELEATRVLMSCIQKILDEKETGMYVRILDPEEIEKLEQ